MISPTTPGQQRQAIEQEAARLFHLTRDSGTDDIWERVYRWIEENPAHGVAFAKAEASWEITHGLQLAKQARPVASAATDESHAEAVEKGGYSPGSNGMRFSRRSIGAIAAGFGVALAASGTWSFWRMTAPERYGTKVGEERLVQLADGSRVQLNTDSAIDVNLHRGRRAIHLLRGEAHFDLALDSAHPFRVTARDGAVLGSGTAFNLRQKHDFTELTVIEGKVELVDDGAAGATVQAGSAATMRTAAITITPLTPREISLRTAWEKGNIQLDRETLEQAVEEFNRYREKPLVIGDRRLAKLQMGGVFSARHSDDFIEALKETFGVRSMQGENGEVILVPEKADART